MKGADLALEQRDGHECGQRVASRDRVVPAHRAERPRAPGGVAAFMSAHSKPPYITPGMEFSSEKGVVRGRRVQQLAFA